MSEKKLWISDFPLPRKGSLWKNIPTKLHVPLIEAPSSEESLFVYPDVVSVEDSFSFADWERMIAICKQSGVEKVVLARKTTICFAKPLSPVALFHHLKRRSPNAFVFALILSPDLAFLGATPEKLFIRKGLQLETEALAGTRICLREEELLHSKKDLKEFLSVKETLTEQLKKICNPFSINQKIFIKKAGNVSHLHYPFHVELKEPIPDESLISLLHPTPAIGGRPKDLALDLIYRLEPFDRGFYAGTIGITSESESHIYVGIRSALIERNKLHIFTGAGILEESDPFLEWQELNHKQGLFYDRC